jgi:sugar lactone lactonase YvrE
MNNERSRRRAGALGSAALFLLATGCSGGLASTGTNGAAIPAQSRAESSAARSSRMLYVSTLDGGSVVVYSTGSHPKLMQTITDGVPRPAGVWVDAAGVLYAVNVPGPSYQTSLPEYKPDASSPFRTITDGIVNAGNVAVDTNGNVYVTGIRTQDASIFLEIYRKGQLSPSQTLTVPHTGLAAPAGLAFDSTGALLVGESLFAKVKGAVYRLVPGSQTFTNLGLGKAPGGAIALDGAGNLYAGGNNSIAVYAPNSQTPSRTIDVQRGVSALAAGANGELYVGTFGGVVEYAPGSKKPATMLSIQGHVGGIALSRQR